MPKKKWQPIETVPAYVTVLLYRRTDLYPVVGHKAGHFEDTFIFEEGGPEDGEHRKYPILTFKPTHWRLLPPPPALRE